MPPVKKISTTSETSRNGAYTVTITPAKPNGVVVQGKWALSIFGPQMNIYEPEFEASSFDEVKEFAERKVLEAKARAVTEYPLGESATFRL